MNGGLGLSIGSLRKPLEDAPATRVGNRVLLVDDNAGIRAALTDLLTAEGLVIVGQAVNGVEAISMSRELHPDLVLLDDQMPELTGREALPHIRRESPGARILLFSAGVEPIGSADSPDAALAKGSHPSQLLHLIRGLLAVTAG